MDDVNVENLDFQLLENNVIKDENSISSVWIYYFAKNLDWQIVCVHKIWFCYKMIYYRNMKYISTKLLCLTKCFILIRMEQDILSQSLSLATFLENNTWFSSVLPCMYWRIIHSLYHILSRVWSPGGHTRPQPVYYSPVHHARQNRWKPCIILIFTYTAYWKVRWL